MYIFQDLHLKSEAQTLGRDALDDLRGASESGAGGTGAKHQQVNGNGMWLNEGSHWE